MILGLFAQEKVVRLFESGMNPKDISRELEIPVEPKAITAHLIQFGIDMTKYDQSQKNKVLKDNRPVWQIARDLDIHPSVIYHWRREAKKPRIYIPKVRAKKIPMYLQLETRLMELFAQGMTNKQVAHELGYSVENIGQLLHKIYRHRGVKSKAEWIIGGGMKW